MPVPLGYSSYSSLQSVIFFLNNPPTPTLSRNICWSFKFFNRIVKQKPFKTHRKLRLCELVAEEILNQASTY